MSLAEKRRSVRSYLDSPVEREKIDYVLRAACLAPSACNNQPWEFIVIAGEYSHSELAAIYDRPWFISAPVIIAACCDRTVSWRRKDGRDFGDIDVAIALDHLTLAAAEQGLGTCWIGAFDSREAGSLLRLPSTVEPIAFTPLGYPSTLPAAKPRKGPEKVVHWGYYGGKEKTRSRESPGPGTR